VITIAHLGPFFSKCPQDNLAWVESVVRGIGVGGVMWRLEQLRFFLELGARIELFFGFFWLNVEGFFFVVFWFLVCWCFLWGVSADTSFGCFYVMSGVVKLESWGGTQWSWCPPGR